MAVADFRLHTFALANVDASGKDVGANVYWQFYAAENLIRVVVHSVLSVQVGPDWWKWSVDPALQEEVRKRRRNYARQPGRILPGKHGIYYTFLMELNAIITAHSHLFLTWIPDIDDWIARIEEMRLPRNVVGHMNWPHTGDRQWIATFHSDFQVLVTKLNTAGVSLVIP